MAQCLVGGNAPAGLADDRDHLAFIVEAVGFYRADHRLQMPDLARREALEDHRLLLVLAAGLLDMRLVVEADAEDLVGVRDHGQEGDVGEFQVGDAAINLVLGRAETAIQQALQVGIVFAEARTQIDDAVTDHGAEARLAALLEAQQFHG